MNLKMKLPNHLRKNNYPLHKETRLFAYYKPSYLTSKVFENKTVHFEVVVNIDSNQDFEVAGNIKKFVKNIENPVRTNVNQP